MPDLTVTPPFRKQLAITEKRVFGRSKFSRPLGIRLISGRDFTDADTAASSPVAIVNEKLAQQFFNGNTISWHFFFQHYGGMPSNIEIVGVVRNSQHAEVRDEIMPLAYFSYRQDPSFFQSTFYVRVAHNLEALSPELRRSITSLDPLPIYDVEPLAEKVSRSCL